MEAAKIFRGEFTAAGPYELPLCFDDRDAALHRRWMLLINPPISARTLWGRGHTLPPTGPMYVLLVTTELATRYECCGYGYSRPRIVSVTIAMLLSFAEGNLTSDFASPAHHLLSSEGVNFPLLR